MIFILFAYGVILQDLVPKEEKNEISIHAHFTSYENEFHMNFQWVFLSREAQQYGADKCVHLDHLFRKYLRKQIFTSNFIFLFQGRSRHRHVSNSFKPI